MSCDRDALVSRTVTNVPPADGTIVTMVTVLYNVMLFQLTQQRFNITIINKQFTNASNYMWDIILLDTHMLGKISIILCINNQYNSIILYTRNKRTLTNMILNDAQLILVQESDI